MKLNQNSIIIYYVDNSKNVNNVWFGLEYNKEGTWCLENAATLIAPNMSFTSNLTFIPYIHSTSASEISVPEIDGKRRKMYRGDHFKPLWARNVPKLELAHLMALGQ